MSRENLEKKATEKRFEAAAGLEGAEPVMHFSPPLSSLPINRDLATKNRSLLIVI
jgi:hypothetical protein